jgi:Family of unknown function (DUF6152)
MKFSLIGTVGVLTIFVTPGLAHHSSSAFDLSKSVELNATVTKFEFVNPHSYVYFTTMGANGKPVEGRCELPAVIELARHGWTRTTFRPGEKVIIKGAPARNEANVCMLQSFVGDDGREIKRDEDIAKNGVNPLATLANRSAQTSRPVRLADGHPNLQGPWVGVGGPDGRGPLNRGIGGFGPGGPGRGPGRGRGRGRGGPPHPEVTAAGALAAKNYDQPFDDPAIKCDPANILFAWVHDRHVNDIIQKNDQIILKYGYMDMVRTIHMNMSQHPKNIKPSEAGHSIGRWDGDTLVVDTVGFSPGVLIPIIGVMYSNQMHVVERFTVDPNAKTLTRTYVAQDPLYLKAPYTGRDVMKLSDEPYVAYNCVELSGKNNVRPKKK